MECGVSDSRVPEILCLAVPGFGVPGISASPSRAPHRLETNGPRSGFRALGFGFWVSGFGLRVSGLWGYQAPRLPVELLVHGVESRERHGDADQQRQEPLRDPGACHIDGQIN